MASLLTLFSKEQTELETELNKATSTEQVVKLVQNRLDHLEKSYMGQLNVAQVRLASLFMDTLRQSITTLSAANEIQLISEPQPIINQAIKSVPNKLILKVLQALIALGILGSLFSLTKTDPGVWMGILLMFVLLGLEVALQLDKNNQKNISDLAIAANQPTPVLRIDSKVLLDNLADALAIIDNAVARLEEGNKPVSNNGIEQLPELLNLIQRLWGASLLEKPQMALDLSKLLPQILITQGIRAQVYQENIAGSDRQFFEFEPNIDPDAKDYVTVTPALFKGDRLLRRGRVIEPASADI
ncbi:hypothetical protein Cri9333_0854 [Crinalium epipsammum PCC 9333]|uniref:Uncharacterized protein n=1 Tax=Crinalium epipsammum PCC 9333 TaxID=1173022 RepID=K9VUY5_9CYAN|nr:hypothetical protein [Crinalium epipsammum]AFZ11771.1 hypothetical protein Cri9333_0854 [Crinalium epipsammum PCC 9333]